MERLQKVLSSAGIASRRHSAEIIRAGRVEVDGKIVTEPGARLEPERVEIKVDGEPVRPGDRKAYLLLNKPAGYLSTVHDPEMRPTVLDLVPSAGTRLFPVGRLDLDTEGLLLLTNDGDAAYALTHPKFEVPKTYIAKVAGVPGARELEALSRGVNLGGTVTAPAKVRIVDSSRETSVLEIQIHEGRKREVRNMLQAIGHPVIHLKRTRLGRLALGDLPVGKWRRLTNSEVRWVRRLVAKVLAEKEPQPQQCVRL